MRRFEGMRFVLVLALLVSAGAPLAASDEIPARPEELSFEPLDWQVPRAEPLRHELPGGIVVYVAEDPALPLVDVGIQLRIGSFLEGPSQVGLASLAGSLMRSGGTVEAEPSVLDEKIDALAMDVSFSIGDTQGRASMNCLSSVLEECLELFFEMQRQPRFDAARLDLEKSNLLEDLKQRNDQPQRIAAREWQWLMYGEEHFSSRMITEGSLEAIERDDLVAFHAAHWRPEKMIFTVSGDVETEAVLDLLERHLADWPGSSGEGEWPPPESHYAPKPGVYYVDKDIPQSRVQIGSLFFRYGWDSPDFFPLMVMNDILGGSGFTARLMKRIRSDEGLAYSAGSTFDTNPYWTGDFRVFLQTKNPTVAYAAKIAYEELERLRGEPVSADELTTAINSVVDTYPARFESPAAIAGIFATDELYGRPHSYWYDYRERVRAVTAEEVQRVARKYLKPEEMVFLVVGKWDEVEPGDADARATMEEFFGGKAIELPLRDPLTLEPMP